MPLAAQVVPAPKTVLGFVPGTDRKLVEWAVLIEYYQELADPPLIDSDAAPMSRRAAIVYARVGAGFFNALKSYRETGKP